MKTHLKAVALGLFALIAACRAIYAQTGYVVHDLSTGLTNGSTTLLSYGATDDTWTVSPPGSHNFYQAALVCSNLNGAWGINGCGRWITPKLAADGIQPAENVVGTYQYKTTFNLSTLCFPWAKLNLSYVGGDNNVVACYVNGHSYTLNPAAANDYNPLTQNVTINLTPADLQLGLNAIIIQVYNTESWTGFYACGNVSVGYCPRPGRMEQQAAMASLQVFPNPSNGHFVVVPGTASDGGVVVADLMGRKIQDFRIQADHDKYSVDLSGQPKGIYILSVRTIGGATETRKIVLE